MAGVLDVGATALGCAFQKLAIVGRRELVVSAEMTRTGTGWTSGAGITSNWSQP